MKTCTLCGQVFEASTKYFPKRSDLPDGLDSECRECKSIETGFKGYGKRSCKNCGKKFSPKTNTQLFCKPECASKFRLKESAQIGRFLIFERDNFQCIYCGATSIEDRVKLHVDHIYPVSLGGTDVASNLVTSCIACNETKGNRVIRGIERIQMEVHQRNLEWGILPDALIKIGSPALMEPSSDQEDV